MSRTTTLNEILSVLDTFVEREGHACVPAAHIERGIRLGDAIDHVRSLHEGGLLPDKAAAALQARAGWFWERGETAHHGLIRASGEFIAHHGHAKFPAGSDLASASATVRRELQDGVISPVLFEALQSFPEWKWEDVYDYGWNDRYRELIAFGQANGHLRIPEVINGSSRLCQWASWQRARYFAGDLPTSRRHRLEMAPNWVWKPERAIRQRYVDELRKHLELHGTTDISNAYVTPEGYRLGRALAQARVHYETGRLAAGTIAALESVPGWTWDKKRAPKPINHTALAAYRSYVEREGNGDVPGSHVEDGFALGVYFSDVRCRLRSGQFGTRQRDALDEISRDWRRGRVAPGEAQDQQDLVA